MNPPRQFHSPTHPPNYPPTLISNTTPNSAIIAVSLPAIEGQACKCIIIHPYPWSLGKLRGTVVATERRRGWVRPMIKPGVERGKSWGGVRVITGWGRMTVRVENQKETRGVGSVRRQ
eukprot:746663-Hanusia_phi.AAC.6